MPQLTFDTETAKDVICIAINPGSQSLRPVCKVQSAGFILSHHAPCGNGALQNQPGPAPQAYSEQSRQNFPLEFICAIVYNSDYTMKYSPQAFALRSRSRAMDACEPCQAGNRAALSGTTCAARAPVRSGCLRRVFHGVFSFYSPAPAGRAFAGHAAPSPASYGASPARSWRCSLGASGPGPRGRFLPPKSGRKTASLQLEGLQCCFVLRDGPALIVLSRVRACNNDSHGVSIRLSYPVVLPLLWFGFTLSDPYEIWARNAAAPIICPLFLHRSKQIHLPH